MTAKTEAPKKTAYLIIESARSQPQLDEKKMMIPDGNGGYIQRPDPNSWQMLLPHDVPEWLKESEPMTRLVAGEEVSMKPEQGGRWYRAFHITNESKVVGADGITARPIGDVDTRLGDGEVH
jgi:hypothetical protein